MPAAATPWTKQGDWAPSTNTPTLASVPTLTAGQYYECTDSGTFLGIDFNTEDFIYAKDGSYQKLDNNDPLTQRLKQLHNASLAYAVVARNQAISTASDDATAKASAAQAAAIAASAPAAHTHAISAVTGLQTALDGKQAAGSYAAAIHTHAQADVTGLVAALAGKAASTHTHAISDTTGLQTALDGKDVAGAAATAQAFAIQRGNHTGTQAAGTITGLAAVATTGAKADVGLGNVDNTSDANKPVSSATTTALAGKRDLSVVQFPTPTTGQTQTFNALSKDELIACNHSATIAAQTFVFPSNANSQIGQEIRIFSRSIITTVTLTTTGLTMLGTALTTFAANGNVAWRKVAASTWVRIQ